MDYQLNYFSREGIMNDNTQEETFENDLIVVDEPREKEDERDAERISNAETNPLPSSSRSILSNDRGFEIAETCSPKLNLGISEDNNDHFSHCNFVLWNKSFRKSIVTSKDFRNHLVEFTVRVTGKNKAARTMNEIERNVDEQLTAPLVQKYLTGSASTFEKFRNVMLSKCTCPSARLLKSTVQKKPYPSNLGRATASSSKVFLEPQSVLSYDLDLSESESD